MIKPPANRLPPTLAAVLMGIIFLSGMAGLTYEVLWLRQLNLIFGVTAFALSVTLAAFMGGLALGSYLFGRLADRLKAPLLVYAALEAGIGIYALMAGHLFSGLDSIYITAGRTLGFQHPLIEVFKTVGAFLIILLPTTLMGGTLPVLSKVFVRREEDLGLKVSMLYALNTFGALVGTFLTGFFLIRSLGMAHTTYLAAAVNLLVALAAGLLSRLLATPQAGLPEAASPPVKVAAGRIRLQRLVLGAMALSGFTALCYEVLWTRALVYFLGLTTYAFTTMLTAFLLGLAAGSLIMSRFIDRFKDHLAWLAATQLMIALGALALMPAINLMHPAGQALGELLGRESWWAVVGIRFLIALALMLP
ncbi:MAG: fused MFS/spermidine synthase, partial [Candidatus Marinimicrobia bacterium]|nr:fused MFS/spermidine synthase [Candidatus Neomarinimicrobiota bacterium]